MVIIVENNNNKWGFGIIISIIAVILCILFLGFKNKNNLEHIDRKSTNYEDNRSNQLY